jgi:hypothetical protein
MKNNNRLIKKIFTSCLYYYFKKCGFKRGIQLRIAVADLVNIINPNVFDVITVCRYVIIVKIENLFRKVLKQYE